MSTAPHLVSQQDPAHPHTGDVCPLCEQPIAAEQRAEVWERIKAHQQVQEIAQAAELNRQVAAAVKTTTATLAQSHAEAIGVLQKQLAEARQARTKDIEQAVARETAKVREVLSKDKDEALNKQVAKHFDENQKLQAKLQEAQRQLERERADRLGEGQEVDLYNELKQAFPHDTITRIGKGEPGADIRHEIMERGKRCGTILYESKNSMQWRDGYATKLRKDQVAAKADHAILASLRFPEKCHELALVDGVVVVNPRRVVVVARILRESTIQIHRLHLSAAQGAAKRDELYQFITSPRCEQMLSRTSELTDALLELEKTEHKQHERLWKQRGTVLKQLEKAQADFRGEIACLVEG